jgi:hypothetical protein
MLSAICEGLGTGVNIKSRPGGVKGQTDVSAQGYGWGVTGIGTLIKSRSLMSVPSTYSISRVLVKITIH